MLRAAIVLQIILIIIGLFIWREARATNEITLEGEPYQSFVVINEQGLLEPIQENAVHARFADNNETYKPPPPPKPVVIKRKVDVSTLTLREKAIYYDGTAQGQCVIYAKKLTGITDSIGFAGDIVPNIEQPLIGDWILIGDNHAGVIVWMYINNEGNLIYQVADSNNRWTGIADFYDLPADSGKIRGFYRHSS